VGWKQDWVLVPGGSAARGVPGAGRARDVYMLLCSLLQP
ncbi:hypothetical protein A2U01_0101831, partial [Trifolium medium]|nr:hypothetical protein [Trifolium medium]